MATQSTRPIYPEPRSFPEVVETPADREPPPSPHVEHSYTPEVFVCVRCGSTNIGHGTIIEFTGHRFEDIRFAPKRISLRFLNSILSLRPRSRLMKMDAEVCRDCGAILLTVDTEELRRIERRR